MIKKIYKGLESGLNQVLKPLVKPDFIYENILKIDEQEIQRLKSSYGIGGIILDIDNTIKQIGKEIRPEVLQWIVKVTEQLKVCLVSNNFKKETERIGDQVGIDCIGLAGKPKRKPFLEAQKRMQLNEENILVIGNERLTDIWGGKRCGMWQALIKENVKEHEER